MNEATVSDEATKLLVDLREMLEAGGRFVLEQAPPLAREIIAYGRAWETLQFVGCGLVAICAGVTWVRMIKKIDYNDETPFVMSMVSGAVTILSTIGCVASARDFVLAWFAPRLYLLEYVIHAVTGGCK